MYQTPCAIEKVVSEHFSSLKHIYVTVSFKECIEKIKLTNVLPLFCDTHRDCNMGTLIMKYVKVRYYFESKRLQDVLLSKEQTKVHANFKLAKTAHMNTI